MHRCDQMRQFLLSHREEILADTLFLARHQSPSSNKALTEQCAQAIQTLMRSRLQAEPEAIFPQESFGPHLSYRIGQGRPIALMLGHYDTVWNPDTLPLVQEGNLLRGPGVYDMKYGIVAGIWALLALQHTDGLPGCFGLFFNSDEEMGSRSSHACFEPIAKAYPNALILEPASAGGEVKIGRKCLGEFHIQIHGIAAHAGTDYAKGRSAILEAAYLIQELFAMTDLDKGITVNVGVISGGTKRNVIAAEAELIIDTRVLTAPDGQRITEAIYALKPHLDGVQLEISGGLTRPPFEFTPANQELFETAKTAAAELGRQLKGIRVGGGSDGNFTSTWGIPTLDGLGPVGDGAHAVTEHMLIEESLEHTAFLANLLTKL